MYTKLRLEWMSNEKKVRPLYGIQGEVQDEEKCASLFNERLTHATAPWPYYPEHPPIVVKTHFPQVCLLEFTCHTLMCQSNCTLLCSH
jgi:hypothetical protein